MYYETRGLNDPIRIELIKGSYMPRFRRRDGSNIEVERPLLAAAALQRGASAT